MKKYFFNEDGTIKIITAIILIAIIFVIAVVLIVVKLYKNDYFNDFEPHTTKKITSKLVMCDDCIMKFTVDELVLNPYSEYGFGTYIEVENIAINSVKFEIEDTSLFSIENRGGKLTLVTKNKVGETKLTATYDKIKISIPVKIEVLDIKTVSFVNHPYYVYNGKENDIEIITDPIGIDLSLLDISVENTDIAEFIDGKLIGKSIGETIININFKGEVFTQDIIVLDDLIHIYETSNKEELYNIKLSDIKDNIINIVLTLDDNKNIGYTSDNIEISHYDENTEVIVEYDGQNISTPRSYKYKITLSNTVDCSSVIKFNINNDTYRLLTIE
ncbi:MAG: hypothetical protein J1F35_04925 [Erysipelotrichales bacterium]|nr:hypothetical protein [Erysipelotrichales bacterium]